jgi:hypothetical protein
MQQQQRQYEQQQRFSAVSEKNSHPEADKGTDASKDKDHIHHKGPLKSLLKTMKSPFTPNKSKQVIISLSFASHIVLLYALTSSFSILPYPLNSLDFSAFIPLTVLNFKLCCDPFKCNANPVPSLILVLTLTHRNLTLILTFYRFNRNPYTISLLNLNRAVILTLPLPLLLL